MKNDWIVSSDGVCDCNGRINHAGGLMEWVDVKDQLPDVRNGIFQVKTSNDKEYTCFFYHDKMQWIGSYGKKPCYWWNASYPHEPLHDVTHWESHQQLKDCNQQQGTK